MKAKGILLVIVLIIGAIVFWKRDEIKKRFGIESSEGSTGTDSLKEKTTSPSLPASRALEYLDCKDYPLQKGCKGNNVLSLQKALNKAYNTKLSEDGYFGPNTESALIANGYSGQVKFSDMAKIAQAMV
jgi:hypothetical protein